MTGTACFGDFPSGIDRLLFEGAVKGVRVTARGDFVEPFRADPLGRGQPHSGLSFASAIGLNHRLRAWTQECRKELEKCCARLCVLTWRCAVTKDEPPQALPQLV